MTLTMKRVWPMSFSKWMIHRRNRISFINIRVTHISNKIRKSFLCNRNSRWRYLDSMIKKTQGFRILISRLCRKWRRSLIYRNQWARCQDLMTTKMMMLQMIFRSNLIRSRMILVKVRHSKDGLYSIFRMKTKTKKKNKKYKMAANNKINHQRLPILFQSINSSYKQMIMLKLSTMMNLVVSTMNLMFNSFRITLKLPILNMSTIQNFRIQIGASHITIKDNLIWERANNLKMKITGKEMETKIRKSILIQRWITFVDWKKSWHRIKV